MNLYHTLLFFHISGTILLFIAWSMEYVQVSKINLQMNMANSCAVQKKKNRHSMIAMVITLGSGIWLMLLLNQHAAWMLMAMIALALIMATGLLLFRMAAKSGANHDKRFKLLALSIRVRLSIGTGIIVLMVFKPSAFWTALLVILFSVIAGIIWQWGNRNRAQT